MEACLSGPRGTGVMAASRGLVYSHGCLERELSARCRRRVWLLPDPARESMEAVNN